METGDLPKSRTTLSRRKFTFGGLAMFALGAIGLAQSTTQQTNKESTDKPLTPVPPPQFPKDKPVATPTIVSSERYELPKMRPIENIEHVQKSAIDAISSISLGNLSRTKLEQEYASHALTIKDIIQD